VQAFLRIDGKYLNKQESLRHNDSTSTQKRAATGANLGPWSIRSTLNGMTIFSATAGAPRDVQRKATTEMAVINYSPELPPNSEAFLYFN